MTRPNITFFSELPADELEKLFAEPGLIEALEAMGAEVSLGLLDLSDTRAEVVRKLNQARIPVTAWLLLPTEEGYWFNSGNAPQAIRRYAAFKEWTEQNMLAWAGIGLDIEPDIRAIHELAANRPAGVRRLLGNLFNGRRFKQARIDYDNLVKQIRMDGYYVESYQFPVIVDERMVGAHLIQRTLGVLDLDVDREVLMLYSSFMRGLGPGLLWSYAKNAQGIGLGSTGGGVELEGTADARPLDWQEFQRDLLLSQDLERPLYIFSLEGCQRQGFLERLVDFDWDHPVIRPSRAAERVERYRRILRGGLKVSENLWLVVALAAAWGVVAWWFRREKK